MSRNTKRRLQKVSAQIGSIPLPQDVVKAAFETFQSTGELPEDRRLAAAVIKRVKYGAPVMSGSYIDWGATVRAGMQRSERPADELMDSLYREAVWADGMVQFAAREVLKSFASAGLDVTEPLFTKHDLKLDLPDYGGVGTSMLGLPDRLARPPYEEQGRRLFARYEQLRQRINRDDEAWFDAFGEAVDLFHQLGELPEDELLRDAVLADAEVCALYRHVAGKDVTEVMGAFDAAAKAADEDKAVAIERVRELVAAGSLRAR